MKILFIAPYMPNLVRVRPFNIIRHLADRGHELTVATLWENDAERGQIAQLTKWGVDVVAVPLSRGQVALNCLKALPTGNPIQASYSWQPALLTALQGQPRTFDVIHVEHLRGSRFGLAAKELWPQVPVLWDAVDCITHLFRQTVHKSRSQFGRWRSRFELARTQQYEAWLLSQFKAVTVTSQVDRDVMEMMNAAHRPIHVVPNGVNLDYFRPNPALSRQPNTIVVSGKMSYHANVSMVLYLIEKIMPLVWQRNPNAVVQVVGKDPTREIKALAGDPRITVTGSVPDMRPYLQQAALAVSPITYGTGIQNKVLEAMACGTPVVATPQAISALNVTPGHDILVAENERRFASHICSLLDDPQRRTQLGAAGYAYVTEWHNWQHNITLLEDSYYEIVGRKLESINHSFG
jgi:sugar transferase (PEP-CTERM/EpsH1 system associated)